MDWWNKCLSRIHYAALCNNFIQSQTWLLISIIFSFQPRTWRTNGLPGVLTPGPCRTWGCLELHQRGGRGEERRINIWNSLSELKYKTNIKSCRLYFIRLLSIIISRQVSYKSHHQLRWLQNIPALLVAVLDVFANNGDRAEHFSRIITSFLPLVTSSNTGIEKAINDFLQRKSLA